MRYLRSKGVVMFEDKIEAIIKEEVSKAVSGVVTQRGIEKAVSKAIMAVFEPLARQQELAAQTYISEKDVGKLFPIASSTLKTWRCRKIPGPPYSRIGDRIVYKLSDLHDFFNQHKV